MSMVVMDIMKPILRNRLSILSIAAVSIVSGCSGYGFFGQQTTEQSTIEQSEIAHYTVQYEDTLSVIAKRHDTPFATLIAANNIAPPYHIRVGDVLRIPLGVSARRIWPSPRRPLGTSVQRPPSVSRPAPSESLRHVTLGQVEGVRYAVRPGDSLSEIASRHSLSVADLITVNAIPSPYQIHPGQDLIIPPSEETLQLKAHVLNEIRKQEAVEAAPSPPLSSDGFLWPVEGTVIRTFQQNNVVGQSGAINIAARIGTPVRATNNGIVAFVGKAFDRYGQMIVLRHADDYVSLYAHNDALHVEEGDTVRRGQVIADVGNSGDVADGQLRFEVRKGIQPIDPARILAGRPGRTFGSL